MVTDFRSRSVKWRPNYAAEDELHAYVDGTLDPAERSRIESFLGMFPEERERLDIYRQQNVLLHRLYDRAAYNDLPPHYYVKAHELSRTLRRGQRARSGARFTVAASVVMLALAGTWTGFEHFTRTENPLSAFTRQATEAHMMLVGDGFPTGATLARGPNESAVLGWLSSHPADVPSAPPDLDKQGFSLIGARVLPTGNGPAVQLLYGNDDRRVTLFMGPSGNGHKTASTVIDDGEVSLVYWQLGDLAYSLIGNVGRKTLLSLASAVSESLKPGEQTPAETVAPIETSPASEVRKPKVAPNLIPKPLPSLRVPEDPLPPGEGGAVPVPESGLTEAGMKPRT